MATTLAANVDLKSAIAEAEARFAEANPISRQAYNAATSVMPGGNTRTVLFYPPFPLAVAKGHGVRVTDADGHDYLDVVGEFTAGLYGHSHPVIMAAIRRALDDGIVLGGHNLVEAKLADAVCARFPSIERVRFTNSGTEANLMALTAARAFTGRDTILAMQGGYHGAVFYFANPASPINAPFPFVFGGYNDAEGCRQLIRQHADRLAAVILEPMFGSAGCIRAEPEFLKMLREETRKVGALLIFDEVMTSRLTPGGLQTDVGVTPDLTSLGKYIGGGLSFGAFGGRTDIMDQFDPRRPDALPHAGTFNNNILTMSAGLAGLTQVYTKEAALALNARGEALRGRLNALAAKHALPVQFTGFGSMLAIHFRAGAVRSFADAQAGRNELKPLLQLDLFQRELYSGRRGMYVLSLPMTEADMDTIVEAFEEFFTARRRLLAA
ncbi:MAG: aspartate aminotransferase family protein [Alphaproteobacteria bacterium]|nr:aspartate aminotransferase family protein [Alphaproteobacteria bacterium]